MGSLKFVAKVVRTCDLHRNDLLTIRRISKLARMSYNATNRTVHFLEKEKVITLHKVGSASVVKLVDSTRTKGFIALAESYLPNEKTS